MNTILTKTDYGKLAYLKTNEIKKELQKDYEISYAIKHFNFIVTDFNYLNNLEIKFDSEINSPININTSIEFDTSVKDIDIDFISNDIIVYNKNISSELIGGTFLSFGFFADKNNILKIKCSNPDVKISAMQIELSGKISIEDEKRKYHFEYKNDFTSYSLIRFLNNYDVLESSDINNFNLSKKTSEIDFHNILSCSYNFLKYNANEYRNNELFVLAEKNNELIIKSISSDKQYNIPDNQLPSTLAPAKFDNNSMIYYSINKNILKYLIFDKDLNLFSSGETSIDLNVNFIKIYPVYYKDSSASKTSELLGVTKKGEVFLIDNMFDDLGKSINNIKCYKLCDGDVMHAIKFKDKMFISLKDKVAIKKIEFRFFEGINLYKKSSTQNKLNAEFGFFVASELGVDFYTTFSNGLSKN